MHIFTRLSSVPIIIALAILSVGAFFVSASPAYADPTPTTLTLTDPNGGEIWSDTHAVTWTSTGGVPGDLVSLVYTTNDFVTQSLIVENLPYAAETYAWDTNTVPDGTTYKVKVVSNNGLVFDPSNAVFTVDNTAPTISNVTVPDTTMKIWDTVTATITVGDDAGVTYTLVDGTIDGFALGSLTRVNATTYTATFTVTEGGADVLAGSNIPVANLILADTADVPNQSITYATPISQASDPIDATRPILSSVTIASNNSNTVWAKTGDTVTVSFTSNESIGTPTVTIAGQGAVEAGGPTVWTATYTMQAGDAEGIVPFTINFADLATNAGVQVTATTNASAVTYDETVPTLPVANIVGTTIQAADDTVVLTFSEPVVAADGTWSANEFTSVTGSVTGALTLTNAGFSYSGNALTITLNKATDGMYLQNAETITVDPVLNAIMDLAGNAVANPAVVGTTAVTGDVAAPTVALTYAADSTVYRDADTVTVTATFNESVKSGVGKPQIAIATPGNGDVVATDMTIGANDTIWTYSWNVPDGADDDGTATFTITSTDLAGNANAAATNVTKLIDNTAPTVVSVILADPALKAGETSLVTITFSEPVTAFDNTDITTIEGGGLSAVSSGDGITWTATFTPTPNFEDLTNIITVTLTGLTDIAGNAGAGTSSSANYAIDTLRPSVGVVVTDTSLIIGETSLVTFTFNEAVSGFTNADLTIPNGTMDPVSSGDGGITWTATFTPSASVQDAANVITVDMTSLTDGAGNTGLSTTDSNNFAIDTLAPTVVSIILADTDLKIGDTSLVTITFSEPVTNFDVSDVTTIDNGSLPSVSSSDGGTTWTGTFTPNAGVEDGSNVITVTLTGLTDVAGNAGAGSTSSGNYIIDTLAPTLSSIHIESNNTTITLAKSGDTVTLTFTSSETISTPTVLIQGVAATVDAPVGNNWTAHRAMTGTDTEGAVTFSVVFADSPAGNSGTTVTAVSDASSVLYDRTNPSVNAGTDKEVNATVSQDATTSDGGSGLATHAWTKISGPGTITFGSPAAVDTTISADTDGTYTIRLTVTDNAGNIAFDEITFIWDTTRPEPLTSNPSDGSTGVSISADTATVTFDEDIVWSTNGTRVLLVNDVTSASHKDTVAVDGGDGASAVLNIDYTGLDYGTKYRINVKPNAVTDVAGNSLASNFIAYFTTEIDTTVPVVNSFSAGSITTTGATLSLTTDESATCSYSTTDSAYSGMTAFDGPNTGTSHTAVLTSLTSSTGYDYFIRCADTSAQTNTMTTSAHVSFTTLTPDTTAPSITNIQSTSISQTGATITWATDENATSRVEYGSTSGYGTLSAADGSADNTSHSVALTGLTAGTTYHFRVLSTDGASNAGTSVDGTFTTLAPDPDTATPPVPSITTGTATVNSDSYTISGTAGADTPVPTVRTISVYNGATLAGTAVVPVGQTGWSVSVTLTQDSANSFTAISSDASGNVSAASSAVVITEDGTVGADVTAPDVPAITTGPATVDANTYEIVGTEANDSGVRTVSLFESGSVIGTVVLPAGQTDWAVTVTLLQNVPNVITAKATDEAGNTSAASASLTITEATAADTTAPVSSNIQATSITTSGATITWSTDENATSLVEYGLTSAYGATSAVDLTADNTSHSVALSGLSSGTTYHFRVVSADTLGNAASSTDSTFTTVAVTDTTAPAVPVITTGAATIDADTYTISGTAGDDGDTRTITILRNGTTVGTLTLGAGVTSWSFIASLAQGTANSFTANSTDTSSNTSADSTAVVITEEEGTASLAVTGIDAVDTFADDTDDFADGWSWTFHITVPTGETEFAMKFADFVSGANTIAAASNIRYYTAQSTEADTTAEAVTIAGANTYPGNITLDSDLDASTAGRQIEVTVEMKVPVGSAGGSYSAQYGVSSDTI